MTISLSGSLPHHQHSKSGGRRLSISDASSEKPAEHVAALLSMYLDEIEACIGDWRALYELAVRLIQTLNTQKENDDYDLKQAAQLALQSEAMQCFFLKFFSTLHSRYFPEESSIAAGLSALTVQDLLAIPFDERRDSFPMREEESRVMPKWVYDNRQKLRDAFVSLLQECLPGSGSGSGRKWTERHLAGKAKELLFSKALHVNGPWLAELFLGQFLKWYNVRRPPLHPSRMEMLEQRLQPKLVPPTPEECFEFFAVLLRTSDSLGLVLSLSKLVPEKIKELEEQCCSGALRRNEMFRNAFILLPGLVKMHGLIGELLQQQPHNFFLQELLNGAKKKKCLLLHLKWAYADYPDVFKQSSFGPSQHGLLAIVGIEAHLDSINALHVDTDAHLDVSFVLEEAFPHLHAKLTLQHTSSPVLPAPRKIQPVLSTVQKVQKTAVQKDLRRWFWWQHPQEFELAKSIVAYARSSITSSEDQVGSSIESSLKALLELGLPSEVSNVVIKLALEADFTCS